MTDPIVADDKDWTWVLNRPCPDCGLSAGRLRRTDIAPALRDTGDRIAEQVRRPQARTRPAPTIWSPLEYGCHVRDVYDRFDQRLTLMLGQDDPLFANWDQDATALEDRYGEQDPAVVADQIDTNAQALAAHFEQVTGDQWLRTGRRSNGSVFTVETLAQYAVHDVAHHVWDLTGACRGPDYA